MSRVAPAPVTVPAAKMPRPAAAAAAADASAPAEDHRRRDASSFDSEVDIPVSRVPVRAGFHPNAAPVRFKEQHAESAAHWREYARLAREARAARKEGKTAVAKLLTDRANDAHTLHKAEKERASRRIAAERNRLHESMRVLDLHGHTVDGALEHVAEYLRHELSVSELIASTSGPVSLNFMVGKGKHSKGGVPKLKTPVGRLVLETGFLAGEELSWEPDEAAVTVKVADLTRARREQVLARLPVALDYVNAKYCGPGARQQE